MMLNVARNVAGTVAGRTRPARALSSAPKRAVLAAVVVGTAVAGFAAGGWDAGGTADVELAHLLRMMAALKLLMVAGGAWFVDWRLRSPASAGRAAAYLGSLGLMAMGPGLIWNLSHVALGAGLLHGGTALLVVLAYRDEGIRLRLRPR